MDTSLKAINIRTYFWRVYEVGGLNNSVQAVNN